MIVLSGGTGTPKLLLGLIEIIPQAQLKVIVNTADDIWVSGNLVCPDIDSLMYTLADLIDEEKWWGIRNDTFVTHRMLRSMGYDELMMIGDKDRATHIIRSDLIRNNISLTDATQIIAEKLGVKAKILPMSDDAITTYIHTPLGKLHFQDFWIGKGGKPSVTDITFEGLGNGIGKAKAKPTPHVIKALRSEDAVVIGPSNPVTSIGPIIHLDPIRKILREKFVIAVSPIIGEKPVSGPAGKFMDVIGLEPSSRGVYEFYKDFLDVLIIDKNDPSLNNGETIRADILLSSRKKSVDLAKLIKQQIKDRQSN